MITEAASAGYVRRDTSVADARRVGVRLTETGRDLLAASHRWQQQTFDDLVAGWDPADRRRLAQYLEGAQHELLAPPLNVLRLSLHPHGMAQRIANLGEWRAHLLSRLRQQATLTADPDLAELYEELRGYPCHQPVPQVELPGPGDVLVRLHYRYQDQELTFLSTTAVFGTPLDVTVAELAIESFYPADTATAAALRALAKHNG